MSQLRAAVTAWRKAGETIGFVPTMGALHAGHMALVAAAKKVADRSVVSAFVNPRQFGPGEDFERYPRSEDADAAMLLQARCDLLFAPSIEDVYPPGFATTVHIAGLGETLEGAVRPGHFDGVATVVARLLTLVSPDVAIFGEKDWQQLAVVRRLVTDLGLSTTITGHPIVREPDGLALSSRNRYLSEEDRRRAPMLHQALDWTAGALRDGIADAPARAITQLEAAGFRVEYLTLVHPETLEPRSAPPGRLLAAARLGATRLIDNLPV